jgi:hypothetical protein
MSDPNKYTIEEVKEWFLPFSTEPNTHLKSLLKYGDNLVKSPNDKSPTAWTKIFGECLFDVKIIPDVPALINDRNKFKKNVQNRR